MKILNSNLKSVERHINLSIMLFDNHFPFQKLLFGHSKYTNVFKNIYKKTVYVIWPVVCEYIYSLKHISLTYFRSIP